MGFCFLGLFGDCADKTVTSTVVKEQIDKMTEVISEKMYKTMTEMKNETSNVQSVHIKVKGNLNMDTISMEQIITMNSSMIAELNNSFDVNTLVDTLVDTAAKTAVDAKNTSILGIHETLTNTEYEIVNSVKTQLKTIIRKEDITSCINKIINEQSIYLEVEGDATLKPINMKMTIDATSKCLINSVMKFLDKVKIDDKLLSKLDTEVKTETGGIWNIVTMIAVVLVLLILGYFLIRFI